jgi:hypothetical protein
MRRLRIAKPSGMNRGNGRRLAALARAAPEEVGQRELTRPQDARDCRCPTEQEASNLISRRDRDLPDAGGLIKEAGALHRSRAK